MSRDRIADDELAFVIQGPIVADVSASLAASIAAKHPRAQVIVSTWLGVDIPPQIRADQIVLSEDPGQIATQHVFMRNAPRLVRSTRAGVAAATRAFVIKLRSDAGYHGGCVVQGSDAAAIRAGRIGVFMHSTPLTPFLVDDKTQIGLRDRLLDFWTEDLSRLAEDPELLRLPAGPRRAMLRNHRHLAIEQHLAATFCEYDLGLAQPRWRWYQDYIRSIRENIRFLNAPAAGFSSKKWAYRDTALLRCYLRLMNGLPAAIAGAVFHLNR